MIIQCFECSKTADKNVFCNNCTKQPDYYDLHQYTTANFDNSQYIGKIKAYRWKDAIDFVKSSLFQNEESLYTNCKKDFAFIEKKDDNKLIGYKIYLNNNVSHSKENKDMFWDLT